MNGFDCALGYGWEDRSLGVRLRNRGLRARQVRNRAVVLHLEHDRPYRTEESLALGLSKLRDVRRAGTVRVEAGIDELDADGWVRRYPEPATND